MSNNKPLDTNLYNRVKKIADLIYDNPFNKFVMVTSAFELQFNIAYIKNLL